MPMGTADRRQVRCRAVHAILTKFRAIVLTASSRPIISSTSQQATLYYIIYIVTCDPGTDCQAMLTSPPVLAEAAMPVGGRSCCCCPAVRRRGTTVSMLRATPAPQDAPVSTAGKWSRKSSGRISFRKRARLPLLCLNRTGPIAVIISCQTRHRVFA